MTTPSDRVDVAPSTAGSGSWTSGVLELLATNALSGWAFLDSVSEPLVSVTKGGHAMQAWGRILPREDVVEAHGSARNPVGFFVVFDGFVDATVGDVEVRIGGQMAVPLAVRHSPIAPPWLHDMGSNRWPKGSLPHTLWLMASGDPVGISDAQLVSLLAEVGASGRTTSPWISNAISQDERVSFHARAAAADLLLEIRSGERGPATRSFESASWRTWDLCDPEYLALQTGPGPGADEPAGPSPDWSMSPNPLMPQWYWRDVLASQGTDPGGMHPVVMALWSRSTWGMPVHPALDDDEVPDPGEVAIDAAPAALWYRQVVAARQCDGPVEGLTGRGLRLWERDLEKRSRQDHLMDPRRRPVESTGLPPMPWSVGVGGVASVARFLASALGGTGDCAHGDTDADGELVSIILPTVRRGQSLVDAVSSVLGQTCRRWELVLVDDSPDGSLDIALLPDLDQYRVTVARTHGCGAAAARNEGARRARGRWLMWLDDDDVLMPGAVEFMLLSAEQGAHVWLYANTALWDGGTCQVIGEPFDRDRLRVDNFVTQIALAVERDVFASVGGYDESLRRTIDYDLVLRLANLHEPGYVEQLVAVADVRAVRRRISTTVSAGWSPHVVNRHDPRWQSAGPTPTRPLSVVVPVYSDWSRAAQSVRRLRRTLAPEQAEIVVVDDGLPPEGFAALGAVCDRHEARLVSTWVNRGFAVACNEGFLGSSSERVVFLNDDVEITGDAILRLAATLDDPTVGGVQALTLMDGGRSYETAGIVFPQAGLPYPFLHGMPVAPLLADDVRRLAFAAVNGAVLAVRSAEFRSILGFDPLFRNGMEDIDFCLRLREAAARRGEPMPIFRVESDVPCLHPALGSGAARTAHIPENRRNFSARWAGRMPSDDVAMWARLGFGIDGYEVPAGESIAEMMPRPRIRTTDRATVGPHAGRSLDVVIATPASKLALEPWGDTFFGMALVRSLRALGVESELLAFDATNHRHDVQQVHLLGLVSGLWLHRAGNVAWVISHPSRHSAGDLDEYAGIIVASSTWLPPGGTLLGRLDQPTDAAQHGSAARTAVDVSGRCLFVGNRRDADRPMVRWAVEAGLPVTVVGQGWDGLRGLVNVDVRAPLPRRDVFALYRQARLVLNDHWPDMLMNGFVSNRLADLRAVGARVATDVPLGFSARDTDGIFAVRGPADLTSAWEWSGAEPIGLAPSRVFGFDEAALRLLDLIGQGGTGTLPTSNRPFANRLPSP